MAEGVAIGAREIVEEYCVLKNMQNFYDIKVFNVFYLMI